MNERINKLIPIAMDALKFSNSQIADSNDKIAKEYKGYISSMGASIMQSGLLATLAFYSKEASGDAERKNVLKALHYILCTEENSSRSGKLISYVLDNTKKENHQGNSFTIDSLHRYKLSIMEERISNALIALKLALRTYHIKN